MRKMGFCALWHPAAWVGPLEDELVISGSTPAGTIVVAPMGTATCADRIRPFTFPVAPVRLLGIQAIVALGRGNVQGENGLIWRRRKRRRKKWFHSHFMHSVCHVFVDFPFGGEGGEELHKPRALQLDGPTDAGLPLSGTGLRTALLHQTCGEMRLGPVRPRACQRYSLLDSFLVPAFIPGRITDHNCCNFTHRGTSTMERSIEVLMPKY